MTGLCPPSSSPVRLSVVDSWTGSRSPGSPPVFLGNGSRPVAPAFPRRVPVSPVPRRQQYYAGATTSHSRIPGHLFVSLAGSTLTSSVRVSRVRAPDRMEDARRAGVFVQPATRCRLALTWAQWDLAGSQAIHPVPLPRSKTPAEPPIPRHGGIVGAAPALPTAKASARA